MARGKNLNFSKNRLTKIFRRERKLLQMCYDDESQCHICANKSKQFLTREDGMAVNQDWLHCDRRLLINGPIKQYILRNIYCKDINSALLINSKWKSNVCSFISSPWHLNEFSLSRSSVYFRKWFSSLNFPFRSPNLNISERHKISHENSSFAISRDFLCEKLLWLALIFSVFRDFSLKKDWKISLLPSNLI